MGPDDRDQRQHTAAEIIDLAGHRAIGRFLEGEFEIKAVGFEGNDVVVTFTPVPCGECGRPEED